MKSQLATADQTDRPKSNPIELRRVAGFFERLAERIEDLQSETSPSEFLEHMWGHWTAARKLFCEALSAGARFDWFPTNINVLRFEQLLEGSDKELGPITGRDFVNPRPKKFLPAIWFGAVFYLTKAHPRFFRSDDPDRFWNPPHSNYPEVSLSLWKRHATIHSDACSLLSTFLYEMADKRPRAKPRLTKEERQRREKVVRDHIRKYLEEESPLERLSRDSIAVATGVPASAVSLTKIWKRVAASKRQQRKPERRADIPTPLDILIEREDNQCTNLEE